MFDIFTAKDARKLQADLKKSNMNYQRDYVIRAIKHGVSLGNNYIVIDFGNTVLFEDDYKFFEDLGYTVKRPHNYKDNKGMYWSSFGVISW